MYNRFITQGDNEMTNLNLLNDLLKMLAQKMDFFMIKACAESAGFELSSMSVPSLKAEIESLIAHTELEEESVSLVIS